MDRMYRLVAITFSLSISTECSGTSTSMSNFQVQVQVFNECNSGNSMQYKIQ